MGQEYLIDTNVVIGYFNDTLPQKGINFFENIFSTISIITRIEILGWHQITESEFTEFNSFIENATVFLLTEPIVLKTTLTIKLIL